MTGGAEDFMFSVNTTYNVSLEPISVGIALFSGSSSVPGSPLISVLQPLVNGRLFSAAGVLIGAEFLLLLIKYLFRLETVPAFDVQNNKYIQIPIGELQALIQNISLKQNSISPDLINIQNAPKFTSPTIFPPESPLIFAIYIAAEYSISPFSPTVWFFIPIFVFPGLRGSLPILILILLETIFIRCVVPPETTGSKPLPKPAERVNPSLNLRPEDLLGILNRFGKYFTFN
jgi:hypothetical protein